MLLNLAIVRVKNAWNFQNFGFTLFILADELVVELFEGVQHGLEFLRLRQDGGTEVVSPWTLSEPWAGHDTDSSLFQQLEGVESVRTLAGLLGFG